MVLSTKSNLTGSKFAAWAARLDPTTSSFVWAMLKCVLFFYLIAHCYSSTAICFVFTSGPDWNQLVLHVIQLTGDMSYISNLFWKLYG